MQYIVLIKNLPLLGELLPKARTLKQCNRYDKVNTYSGLEPIIYHPISLLPNGGIKMWRRRLRYHVLKFLRLKESPRSIAIGFALGASSNFLPFVGFGALASAFLAGLARVNIPASLIGHFLFAPAFPFFFSLNVFIGRLIIKNGILDIGNYVGQSVGFGFKHFANIGKAFLFGAAINSLVFGVIVFIVSYKIFVIYRKDLALWLFSRGRRSKTIPKDKPPIDGKH